MIAAIMQPYFFPYIGYFQLLARSDVFVFHDDVQYVKGSWINRNRLLWNGEARWFTFPVRGGDHALPINRRLYRRDRATIGRLLRQAEAAYRHAPHFAAVYPLVRELLAFDEPNVAAFNLNLIARISAELGIRPRMLRSPSLAKDDRLAGQARVIDICSGLGATCYVNPIGGTSLYDAGAFARHGIELRFLRSHVTPYRQFSEPAVPDLSIIDMLMFNNREAIRQKLQECELTAA